MDIRRLKFARIFCIMFVNYSTELDVDGTYASKIDSADDSYEIRKTYEDSVPKLNWKADEAHLDVLKIIATQLDK